MWSVPSNLNYCKYEGLNYNFQAFKVFKTERACQNSSTTNKYKLNLPQVIAKFRQ